MMESITSYMEQDHVVIDGFAERALQAVAAHDTGALQSEGGEFRRRLRRHIEMEENVLFPAFEERTGMVAAGPSRSLFHILQPLHAKEERMMYPMLDEAAGEDAQALLQDVKAMAV